MLRMPDGGFRPAYNLQMATDVESQVIVAVAVTNRGTDQGEGLPVEEQVAQRTGRHPKAYLMDGGYVDLEQIENLEERGVQVYAPPKEGKGAEEAIRQRRTKPGVEAWRKRMSSAPTAPTIHRHRASTAECVNALTRERHGLNRFNVRGITKVTGVALLVAITHNLMRWTTLTG